MKRNKADAARGRKKRACKKPEQGESVRQDQSNGKGRLSSRKVKIGVVAASCVLILFISILLWNISVTSPQTGGQTGVEVPRAAILDGLYSGAEDSAFEQNLTNFLSTAGYRVDVFRELNVTINLMKNIEGYKILILRVHSAISESDGFLYLFSAETYTKWGYASDQLWGSVREGIPFETNVSYFALNAAFLGTNKPNSLKDTTIILMGCNGTGDDYSIQKFFEKGAKAYVAWTGYVDLSQSDQATLTVIQALCIERLSVKEAVEKAMREIQPDPLYKSVLESFP